MTEDVAPPTASWQTAAVEDRIASALLVAILVVMGLGVFFRYVLNDSLSWTEEISRYGLVYITYLGCATGFRRRSHIRIDVIERVLPARARSVLASLVDLICAVFLAGMLLLSVQIIEVLWASRSAAVQIPMRYVYFALVLGFALALVRLGLSHVPRRR